MQNGNGSLETHVGAEKVIPTLNNGDSKASANARRRAALEELDEAKFSVS